MSYESFNAAVNALTEAKALLKAKNNDNIPRLAKSIPRGTANNKISSSGGRSANTTTTNNSDFREISVMRTLEALTFQREINEASKRVDAKLRSVTSMQGIDLDKEYGITRKQTTTDILSPSMRLLEERSMRSEAMVKLCSVLNIIILIYRSLFIACAGTWNEQFY